MSAAHVTLFLGGAPEAHSLDWSEHALVQTFSPAVKRFLDGEQGSSSSILNVTQANANWRLLSTGSNVFYQSQKQNNRPNISPIDCDGDFLEHSFAVHAHVQSSQLAPHSSVDEDETEISTFVTENSDFTFLDRSTTLPPDASFLETSEPSPIATCLPYRFTGAVLNIKAIPSAGHLTRLQPQTMTVNLIAGVISVAPTRAVRVRRGDYDMDIIEITLGDETKAGFCISSWHTPVDLQRADQDALRETLSKLQPGDIVLVERVALSSFRDQVFGQSLNRRVSKNSTKINVVWRSGEVSPREEEMLSPQVAGKLRRVQDWVTGFIGPAKRATHGLHKKLVEDEERLPPDSQE